MVMVSAASSSIDVDLLVIGGGILGMSVAYLAAHEQPQRRVLVCRLSDDQEPFADTLRNQSWLQSGLRYVSALQQNGFSPTDAIVFARRMRAWRAL